MSEKANDLLILDWLLSRQREIDPAEQNSLADWKALFDAHAPAWPATPDRAAAGGFLADRLAYAFAGGYDSALRRLVPWLPPRALVSLCVSEQGGAHPGAIKSSLVKEGADGTAGAWRLDGRKQFVTNAREAQVLLVAASTGRTPDGKNALRMVMIDRDMPGVQIVPMGELPFVPEISHGIVELRGVRVEESRFLPGDGYVNYIRPFRTIEDLHIFAAVCGHLFRVAALYGWPREARERMLGLLAAVRALALADPDAPGVHIAAGGLQAQVNSLLLDIAPHWDSVEERARARWERDRALLKVAGGARAKRLEKAWSRF